MEEEIARECILELESPCRDCLFVCGEELGVIS
jgi:hypothetical protein